MSDTHPGNADLIAAHLLEHNVFLRGYVYALLRNRAQVDDVMQEVAKAVWQLQDRFEPGTNFMTWAKSIALRRVQEYLRRTRRPDTIPLDDDLMEAVTDEAFEERVSELAVRREEALVRCLEKMPERSRQALLEYYGDRGGYDRVAELLGRTVETAYVIFHRLRKELRGCIEKQLVAIPEGVRP
jgi:RNA polymerase sigma-70 factor, ECF subfamily